jgi:phage terminase large subunit
MGKNNEHNVILTPWQSQVFQDQKRHVLLRCGRRTGKTYLAVTKMITEAMRSKGDYWFVAPYYKQAKAICWRLFKDLIPKEAIHRSNENELFLDLKNGSIISMKGADTPESLRGVGLDGVILDEYAFMRPNVWQEIIRPMLLDRNGWAWIISTPQGYNHYYELWEDVAHLPDWSRYHFTTYDNPLIKRKEIDEARIGMTDYRFAQEILAEFTKVEGAIFDMFDREVHLVEGFTPSGTYPVYGSIDFGFAPGHATAFYLHEVNERQTVTYDGFQIEQETLDKIIERIKGMLLGVPFRTIYCDSARPDLIEQMRRAGLPVMPAMKDVELGIDKMVQMLDINLTTGQPYWAVGSHLKDLIWQLENYRWQPILSFEKDVEVKNFRQKPIKENDDGPDSCRYFIYTYHSRRNLQNFEMSDIDKQAIDRMRKQIR